MALYNIQVATATVPLVFPLNSTASGNPPLTGATPTVLLSKNGAPYAAPAGAVSEIGGGLYQVAPNAVDSNTLGILWLHATATGAVTQDVVYGVTNSALVDSNRFVSANNVSVVVGGGGGFVGASSSSPGVDVNALPPRYDMDYPRGQQVSFVLYLSVPITGRTISWNVRASEIAPTALLTKDNAGNGGITLNSAPVTVGTVTYAPNQVATLTILAADFANTVTFPERKNLWQGWELTGPAEKPAYGDLLIATKP